MCSTAVLHYSKLLRLCEISLRMDCLDNRITVSAFTIRYPGNFPWLTGRKSIVTSVVLHF